MQIRGLVVIVIGCRLQRTTISPSDYSIGNACSRILLLPPPPSSPFPRFFPFQGYGGSIKERACVSYFSSLRDMEASDDDRLTQFLPSSLFLLLLSSLSNAHFELLKLGCKRASEVDTGTKVTMETNRLEFQFRRSVREKFLFFDDRWTNKYHERGREREG